MMIWATAVGLEKKCHRQKTQTENGCRIVASWKDRKRGCECGVCLHDGIKGFPIKGEALWMTLDLAKVCATSPKTLDLDYEIVF